MSPTDWPKIRDRNKRYPDAYALLEELQVWFEGEVEAGDTALQQWLDRIKDILTVEDDA